MAAAGCFDVRWIAVPDTNRDVAPVMMPRHTSYYNKSTSTLMGYVDNNRLYDALLYQQQQPHRWTASVGQSYGFTNGNSNTVAATALASLFRQASPLNNSSVVPYFQPQMISPESEKPIGCGAFGVVWAARDPRTGRRIALKKLPNVFQSLVSCRRVYRELKMLCSFDHDNVLSALDILLPPDKNLNEIYIATELMQTDLHRIIVSQQALTTEHIKVFVYQILRGLKYLHSAKILHRDIKPGNLLVNSNCLLKICDFGLSRVVDMDRVEPLTHEVVTQYYRAPEILMGSRHYTTAVDMWSVGCVLAELLSRHILFQANGPMQQLDLIVDLIGIPELSDLSSACDAARQHILRRPRSPPDINLLYALSSECSHEVVHLLCQLLVFNPERRITATNALYHPYLEDGRLRYHSCMCKCCTRDVEGRVVFHDDLEPCHRQPFNGRFERELISINHIREKLCGLCVDMQQRHYINSQALLFNKLAQSYLMQKNEPIFWD
jgi:nemo like kinase